MESKSLAKLMEIIQSQPNSDYLSVFRGGVCGDMLAIAIGRQSAYLDDEWWSASDGEWIRDLGVSQEEFNTTRNSLVEAGLIRCTVCEDTSMCLYRARYEAIIAKLRAHGYA